jgi:flagella basal body P-ring formation protein FlgA
MSMTQQLKLQSFSTFLLLALSLGLADQTDAETPSDENAVRNENLTNRVEAYLWDIVSEAFPTAEHISLKVRAPDARLNLEQCANAELSLQGTDRVRSRMLVRATCSPSYAIHLAATVEVLENVVVAHRALTRKHTLAAEDLDFATVNILSNQRQFLTEIEHAMGNSLTRSVRSGTPLTQGMVKAPDLVTRGDSVVIVASRGDLVVRMPGIAMMTGGKDDQINVRNQSSDRVVKGWIKAPGEVHVPF